MNLRRFFTLAAGLWLAGSSAFAQQSTSNGIVLFNGEGTTTQSAIFASFLTSEPAAGIDSAISVSNVLAAPGSIGAGFTEMFSDTVGTLEFYLWKDDGQLIHYETEPGSPGAGLQLDGSLDRGQTYRVLLSEILAAAGEPGSFAGYGWVVANFDAVQGTANVTDFSTFTLSVPMQPDLGGFLASGRAGVPFADVSEPQ